MTEGNVKPADYPRWFTDLISAIGFYTRLPIPSIKADLHSDGTNTVANIFWPAPLVGALAGGLAGAVCLAATVAGLPNLVASILAIVASVIITGALHEDGVADMADGFWGGRDRARKLDIMRDSRIGTFGVLAVVFSVVIRIGAIAALLDALGPFSAASLLVATLSVSRLVGLGIPLALPPARRDGLSRTSGRPTAMTVIIAAAIAAPFVLVPAIAYTGASGAITALVGASAGGTIVGLTARNHIGGQTGDVIGAAIQFAEIGFVLGLLVAIA